MPLLPSTLRSMNWLRAMLKLAKVSVRLPEALKRLLEARAQREDETPAEIHRRALVAFLGPVRQPMRSDE